MSEVIIKEAFINRLAPEILIDIFILLQYGTNKRYSHYDSPKYDIDSVDEVQYATYTHSWYRLTHVCSLWRNIALGAPVLWTRIDANKYPVSQTAAYLERSKRMPLFVSMQASETDASGRRRSHPVIPSGSAILEHSDRVQTLVLMDYNALSESQRMRYFGRVFSRLKNVIIENYCDGLLSVLPQTLFTVSPRKSNNSISRPFQHLSGLKLTNLALNDGLPYLPKLGSLSLRFDDSLTALQYPAYLRIDVLLNVLRKCEKLEHLNLDLYTHFKDLESEDSVDVRLYNLKKLRIKAPEHNGMSIFKALDYPFTCDLTHSKPHSLHVALEKNDTFSLDIVCSSVSDNAYVSLAWREPPKQQFSGLSKERSIHALAALTSLANSTLINITVLHLWSKVFIRTAPAVDWHTFFRALPNLEELHHTNRTDFASAGELHRKDFYNEKYLFTGLGDILDLSPPCPNLSRLVVYDADFEFQECFFAALAAMLISRACRRMTIRTLEFVDCKELPRVEVAKLLEFVYEIRVNDVMFVDVPNGDLPVLVS